MEWSSLAFLEENWDLCSLQVGSHFHFIETNPYLIFDREKSYGMRLNIIAGTAVRFEVHGPL